MPSDDPLFMPLNLSERKVKLIGYASVNVNHVRPQADSRNSDVEKRFV